MQPARVEATGRRNFNHLGHKQQGAAQPAAGISIAMQAGVLFAPYGQMPSALARTAGMWVSSGIEMNITDANDYMARFVLQSTACGVHLARRLATFFGGLSTSSEQFHVMVGRSRSPLHLLVDRPWNHLAHGGQGSLSFCGNTVQKAQCYDAPLLDAGGVALGTFENTLCVLMQDNTLLAELFKFIMIGTKFNLMATSDVSTLMARTGALSSAPPSLSTVKGPGVVAVCMYERMDRDLCALFQAEHLRPSGVDIRSIYLATLQGLASFEELHVVLQGIHADVKPNNFLCRLLPIGYLIKLSDFGGTVPGWRVRSGELVGVGAMVHTEGFLSPFRASLLSYGIGTTTTADDLFALGTSILWCFVLDVDILQWLTWCIAAWLVIACRGNQGMMLSMLQGSAALQEAVGKSVAHAHVLLDVYATLRSLGPAGEMAAGLLQVTAMLLLQPYLPGCVMTASNLLKLLGDSVRYPDEACYLQLKPVWQPAVAYFKALAGVGCGTQRPSSPPSERPSIHMVDHYIQMLMEVQQAQPEHQLLEQQQQAVQEEISKLQEVREKLSILPQGHQGGMAPLTTATFLYLMMAEAEAAVLQRQQQAKLQQHLALQQQQQELQELRARLRQDTWARQHLGLQLPGQLGFNMQLPQQQEHVHIGALPAAAGTLNVLTHQRTQQQQQQQGAAGWQVQAVRQTAIAAPEPPRTGQHGTVTVMLTQPHVQCEEQMGMLAQQHMQPVGAQRHWDQQQQPSTKCDAAARRAGAVGHKRAIKPGAAGQRRMNMAAQMMAQPAHNRAMQGTGAPLQPTGSYNMPLLKENAAALQPSRARQQWPHKQQHRGVYHAVDVASHGHACQGGHKAEATYNPQVRPRQQRPNCTLAHASTAPRNIASLEPPSLHLTASTTTGMVPNNPAAQTTSLTSGLSATPSTTIPSTPSPTSPRVPSPASSQTPTPSTAMHSASLQSLAGAQSAAAVYEHLLQLNSNGGAKSSTSSGMSRILSSSSSSRCGRSEGSTVTVRIARHHHASVSSSAAVQPQFNSTSSPTQAAVGAVSSSGNLSNCILAADSAGVSAAAPSLALSTVVVTSTTLFLGSIVPRQCCAGTSVLSSNLRFGGCIVLTDPSIKLLLQLKDHTAASTAWALSTVVVRPLNTFVRGLSQQSSSSLTVRQLGLLQATAQHRPEALVRTLQAAVARAAHMSPSRQLPFAVTLAGGSGHHAAAAAPQTVPVTPAFHLQDHDPTQGAYPDSMLESIHHDRATENQVVEADTHTASQVDQLATPDLAAERSRQVEEHPCPGWLKGVAIMGSVACMVLVGGAELLHGAPRRLRNWAAGTSA